MNQKVYLIPGYNSNHGVETVDKLIPIFKARGLEVEDISYVGSSNGALRQIFSTTSAQNQQTAHRIALQIVAEQRNVFLVAHSNGVAIMSYVIEYLQMYGCLSLVVKAAAIHGALVRGFCWNCPVVHFWGKDSVLTYGANARRLLSATRRFFNGLINREVNKSRWGDSGAHPDTVSPMCFNVETMPGHSDLFKTINGLRLFDENF